MPTWMLLASSLRLAAHLVAAVRHIAETTHTLAPHPGPLPEYEEREGMNEKKPTQAYFSPISFATLGSIDSAQMR
jgi:hypothetical protein